MTSYYWRVTSRLVSIPIQLSTLLHKPTQVGDSYLMETAAEVNFGFCKSQQYSDSNFQYDFRNSSLKPVVLDIGISWCFWEYVDKFSISKFLFDSMIFLGLALDSLFLYLSIY